MYQHCNPCFRIILSNQQNITVFQGAASKMSLPGEREEGGTASKMSFSGEREEGGTASKMSLPGEHDMDTKAKR